ncbi:MAG: SRPBCC family protein [Hyphomonadaceae bacterium]
MNAPRIHHGAITIERAYRAPPARVFAAWRDPEAHGRWDVSHNDWEIVFDEVNFRVGGFKRSRFGPPGDLLYREDSVYLDLIENARIVFAYTVTRGQEPVTASLVTVEFSEDQGHTRLTLNEHVSNLDGSHTTNEREQGWGVALDHLGAALAA